MHRVNSFCILLVEFAEIVDQTLRSARRHLLQLRRDAILRRGELPLDVVESFLQLLLGFALIVKRLRGLGRSFVDRGAEFGGQRLQILLDRRERLQGAILQAGYGVEVTSQRVVGGVEDIEGLAQLIQRRWYALRPIGDLAKGFVRLLNSLQRGLELGFEKFDVALVILLP